MIDSTEAQVPAIMRKVPATIIKILKAALSLHTRLRGSFQLSYSHMQPIGWYDMSVPNKAPTREIRLPKSGMALAMM